jgi:hypothetical protein
MGSPDKKTTVVLLEEITPIALFIHFLSIQTP